MHKMHLSWYTYSDRYVLLVVDMKRFFLWLGVNSDALIALFLAILVTLLDVTGQASSAVLSSATVVTLGVLAFAILHDRRANERTRTAIQRVGLKIDESRSIRVLSGPDISKAIVRAQEDADQWLFRGSTASYVRSVVLPQCLSRTKESRSRFKLRLEILDPRSEQVCAAYVKLYQDLAPEDSSVERGWTLKGTQIELYATILAVCWYMNRYLSFDAEIGLTSIASSFRWEASSKWFILTQRGPQYPAFLIASEDPLYGLFLGELDGSFRQSHQLYLRPAAEILVSDEPSVDEARAVFSKLNIDPPKNFSDGDMAEIIAKALHDSSPYA